MRVIFITTGSGRMACDVCLRDSALVRAIKARGHHVLTVCMYTPSPASLDNPAARIFYGGVNVYLQQKFPFFRHTPRFLDRILDSRWLLDFATRFGHLTQAHDLARMTISVLQGEEGNQRKELEHLLGWLQTQPGADLVVLPNSLLAGLAAPLRRRLNIPVVCMLSGEDMFVDEFPEPHRARALELLRHHAADIDFFITPNCYYAQFMQNYLQIPADQILVVSSGIDVSGYPREERPEPPLFTIGYRSQIAPAGGLHLLVEAFHQLKRNPETAACRLRVAGYLGPIDRPYFKRIQADIKSWGLADDFEYIGEPSPKERIRFLSGLSAFCVPPVYPEPIGIFVPEALAAGVPLVLPRGGCLAEWIEVTGGGLLTDSAHPAALAAALARLMNDSALARQLGEKGRLVIHANHTIERMAESLMDLLLRKVKTSSNPIPGV